MGRNRLSAGLDQTFASVLAGHSLVDNTSRLRVTPGPGPTMTQPQPVGRSGWRRVVGEEAKTPPQSRGRANPDTVDTLCRDTEEWAGRQPGKWRELRSRHGRAHRTALVALRHCQTLWEALPAARSSQA